MHVIDQNTLPELYEHGEQKGGASTNGKLKTQVPRDRKAKGLQTVRSVCSFLSRVKFGVLLATRSPACVFDFVFVSI